MKEPRIWNNGWVVFCQSGEKMAESQDVSVCTDIAEVLNASEEEVCRLFYVYTHKKYIHIGKMHKSYFPDWLNMSVSMCFVNFFFIENEITCFSTFCLSPGSGWRTETVGSGFKIVNISLSIFSS